MKEDMQQSLKEHTKTDQYGLHKVRLEDADRIEHIRREQHHELSSHAFTNLFLWSEQMGLYVGLDTDIYYVKTTLEGPESWYFPCGEENKKRRFIEEYRDKTEFELVYLRETDKNWLERQFPGEFQFAAMTEAEEYIFDRSELQTLSGKGFSNVRNQINGLYREHEMVRKIYTEADEPLVRQLLEKCKKKRYADGYKHLTDAQIPQLALKFRKELGMFAVTVWVDGRLGGITMGFPLTDQIMDGCVERHDSEIHGLSYFTQMALILEAAPDYRYMNGEEDLGLPGLRMMKRHMNPCRMNRIWRARLKDKTMVQGKECIG